MNVVASISNGEREKSSRDELCRARGHGAASIEIVPMIVAPASGALVIVS